jgi:hypothetical protein
MELKCILISAFTGFARLMLKLPSSILNLDSVKLRVLAYAINFSFEQPGGI